MREGVGTLFAYFGYGSNMECTSLAAKGVVPISSERAVLNGWALRFNVEHFFRNEGGVGNIEFTGDPNDCVQGLLHLCADEARQALDIVEAYGVGYDRIDVEVVTASGIVFACTYVGAPSFINDECLPTRRYLNILVKGAAASELDADYIEMLRRKTLDFPAKKHLLKRC